MMKQQLFKIKFSKEYVKFLNYFNLNQLHLEIIILMIIQFEEIMEVPINVVIIWIAKAFLYLNLMSYKNI